MAERGNALLLQPLVSDHRPHLSAVSGLVHSPAKYDREPASRKEETFMTMMTTVIACAMKGMKINQKDAES